MRDSLLLQRTVFLTFYRDCVNVTGYLVVIALGNSSKTCCSLVVLRSLLYGRFADRRFVKGAFDALGCLFVLCAACRLLAFPVKRCWFRMVLLRGAYVRQPQNTLVRKQGI